jgi:hypothetical protein
MCNINFVINNDLFLPEDYVFLFRIKDKKFYRGAKLFFWTSSWRRAALLSKSDWKFILKNHYKIKDATERYAFVDLNILKKDLKIDV